jgi:Protein of unknown function (DUF2778)
MAFEVTEADRLLTRGSLGRSEKGLLALGAVALALGVAAWITDAGQGVPLASAALPAAQDGTQGQYQDQVSFRDRFLGAPERAGEAVGSTLQALDRAAINNLEGKLWDAKALLARQLMYSNWRSAAVDATRPSVDDTIRASVDDTRQAAAGIPLPRPRPTTLASADPQSLPQTVAQADAAPASDNRSLVQKLSDLLPGKVTLASLTTDGGLFRQGPNLAALGYEPQTAVYDLSARAVYLPNGMVLEAHSGMGSLRDDPDHVDRRMVGATPPATYDLKPREAMFHGVAALRMTPSGGATIFGRAGLLVHPYMLGPLGDSNGCVSVRNYDRFLKAYSDGEVTRLVVVPRLNGATATSQRAAAQSSPS